MCRSVSVCVCVSIYVTVGNVRTCERMCSKNLCFDIKDNLTRLTDQRVKQAGRKSWRGLRLRGSWRWRWRSRWRTGLTNCLRQENNYKIINKQIARMRCHCDGDSDGDGDDCAFLKGIWPIYEFMRNWLQSQQPSFDFRQVCVST